MSVSFVHSATRRVDLELAQLRSQVADELLRLGDQRILGGARWLLLYRRLFFGRGLVLLARDQSEEEQGFPHRADSTPQPPTSQRLTPNGTAAVRQYMLRSGAGAPEWRSSSALKKPPITSVIVDR